MLYTFLIAVQNDLLSSFHYCNNEIICFLFKIHNFVWFINLNYCFEKTPGILVVYRSPRSAWYQFVCIFVWSLSTLHTHQIAGTLRGKWKRTILLKSFLWIVSIEWAGIQRMAKSGSSLKKYRLSLTYDWSFNDRSKLWWPQKVWFTAVKALLLIKKC